MTLKIKPIKAELSANHELSGIDTSLERLNAEFHASWDRVDMDSLLKELEFVRNQTGNNSPIKFILDQDPASPDETVPVGRTIITQGCLCKDPIPFRTIFEVLPETGLSQTI